ncbi:MAG: hypothetical protein ABIP55_01000 [Tepidisphaeraceae bacterium]
MMDGVFGKPCKLLCWMVVLLQCLYLVGHDFPDAFGHEAEHAGSEHDDRCAGLAGESPQSDPSPCEIHCVSDPHHLIKDSTVDYSADVAAPLALPTFFVTSAGSLRVFADVPPHPSPPGEARSLPLLI